MGYGYPVELRERVVAYYNDEGSTERETAELFNVGEATVRRWRRLNRELGLLAPRPVSGGNPPRVQGEGEKILRKLIDTYPDSTIAELTDKFASVTQGPISPSSLSRALLRLGLTRKKRVCVRVSK